MARSSSFSSNFRAHPVLQRMAGRRKQRHLEALIRLNTGLPRRLIQVHPSAMMENQEVACLAWGEMLEWESGSFDAKVEKYHKDVLFRRANEIFSVWSRLEVDQN